MKNSLIVILLVFCVSVFAQSSQKEALKYIKISPKKCLKKTGYQLVLKEMTSDSRCPEGVTCVWAGEAAAIISVYKDSKLIDDKSIVFSQKNEEENKQWFASYLPEKQRKIKKISVFPYPKQGITISKKDYFVKIGYSK